MLTTDPTLSRPVPPPGASPDEAEHLRRLLERQPSCVMRIGLDGIFLAVNDRSLNLLGIERLDQILGGSVTDRLVAEHHELWRDFAARVWSAGSGSIECDMIDVAATRRTVNWQGMALADHPDGIRSMLVVARDVSATRQLEQALQEHEATCRANEQLRAELADVHAAQERAQASLSARDAQQQHLGIALDALREELERSLAEGRRLADELAQRDVSRQELEATLAEREIECSNLRTVVERYESEQQRLESELEQAITARETESTNLRSVVERYESEQQRLESELEQAMAARETEATNLRSVVERYESEQRRLESELEQTVAEREQFEVMVKQREATRQRTLAEHATARMHFERALSEATSRGEQLAKALTDRSAELQNLGKDLESLARQIGKPEGKA